MARENNAMSAGELRAFLSNMEWAALGVLGIDGKPVAAVAPILVRGDLLYFSVPEGSPAHASLTRDPRCCCSADSFASYYEIKGATVHGAAAPVEPDPAIAAALRQRAQAHGLGFGAVFTLPLLADSFGFDFAKLARRD